LRGTKEVHLFDFVAESSEKYFKPKLCKACIEYKGDHLPRALLQRVLNLNKQISTRLGFQPGSKNTITGEGFFSELSMNASGV